MARSHLKRHHVVRPDDMQRSFEEIPVRLADHIRDPLEVCGMRVKRNISKGRVLQSSAFEAIPLVERGDKVQVALIIKNLEIMTSAEASQDGWLGDEIRIKLENRSREILGRVTNKDYVEVAL